MDNLRQHAEDALQASRMTFTENDAPEVAQKLIHELQVHQVELEMQNEELRRLHQEVEHSRNRYADLYDFAPVGYLTINDKGLLVEANLTAAAMLSRERSPLLKLAMAHLIAREDQDVFYCHRQTLLDTKTPQQFDLRLQRPDAAAFWAHLVCTPVLDEEGTVAQIRMAITDLTDRKQMEEQLRVALKEKEVLLKEVYHRVKNNFAAVYSLLNLQANITHNSETKQILAECEAHVYTMSEIHHLLYRSDNLAEIDFGGCLKEFVPGLFQTYALHTSRTELHIKADQVFLKAEKAIPAAMIVNELVSNALKYAFPDGRSGAITIELHAQGEQIVLRVQDNGVGLPDGLNIDKVASLGLELTRLFVNQLRGMLIVDRTGGTAFTITFPGS